MMVPISFWNLGNRQLASIFCSNGIKYYLCYLFFFGIFNSFPQLWLAKVGFDYLQIYFLSLILVLRIPHPQHSRDWCLWQIHRRKGCTFTFSSSTPPTSVTSGTSASPSTTSSSTPQDTSVTPSTCASPSTASSSTAFASAVAVSIWSSTHTQVSISVAEIYPGPSCAACFVDSSNAGPLSSTVGP